jgi:hypothetical protein
MTQKEDAPLTKRSWHGEWWLPDRPDTKVAGELTWDPKVRATLTLSGNLTDDDPKWKPKNSDDVFFSSSKKDRRGRVRHIPIILGQTDHSGELISVRATVDPLCILIGKHYPTRDAVIEPCFRLHLSCLQEWINARVVEEISTTSEPQDAITLRVHTPSDIVVNSKLNPMTISFGFSSGGDPFVVDIRQF